MEPSRKRSWERRAKDWPHREASIFVSAGGIQWHAQIFGDGPAALLLHGTGASTHSFRDLAPALAREFRVVAVDLPGHGFTGMPPAYRLSLAGMAALTAEFCRALGIAPVIAIGHSAGAAVAIRMALDGAMAPRGIVSLNGALLPLRIPGARIFSPMAKLLAALPMVPSLFAWRGGSPGKVERLLAGTGSRLDARGIELYRRLIGDSEHVAAALAMMANWDLPGFARDLPKLRLPLASIVGANDRTVPPEDARRVVALVPQATVDVQPGLGHLAHEEDPAGTAALILKRYSSWSAQT